MESTSREETNDGLAVENDGAPTRRRPDGNNFVRLLVECKPRVKDPREMRTILVSSLRALWGDLETHSYGLVVTSIEKESGSSSSNVLSIQCSPESLDAVRAALTLVTPPPFMMESSSLPYRFDVIDITR